tara:strand:- start:105 stop:425 length:321 start_codon:yes stop_codon:yes gene_type:complete
MVGGSMMSNIEDSIVIHGNRIASLEGDVNILKVDTSKLQLTLEHQEDRQKERFDTLCTSQIELKDIMKARAESDERRSDEARKYRAEREQQEVAVQLQKQNGFRAF